MTSANSSSKPYSLAIVGGGISGLALAITLLQYDIPITVYEAAPHFGEIGAGVAFGPNAGRAMELMSPKIYQAFLKCKTGNADDSKRNSWFTIRVGDARKANKDGYVREGKKVGDALFDIPLPSGGGRGGVYRAHFLDELVKDIPDNVAKFDKRLVDIDEADDGSGDIVLKFADDSTAQHTAVVGCDGIKSMTRKWLVGRDNHASKAVFSGKYAYRGLIPMDEAVELLGNEAARNSQMYLGYHGHLLTFPISHGKVMNGILTAPISQCLTDSVITVVAFRSRDTWEDEKWVVSTSKEDMQADFAEWGPHVQKIVGAMQKPDIWALFMHPPCDTYTKGRVCLLGDAAHATTPHQGAGAGMCIEDSYILANLIKDANNTEELQRAFSAFDQVRRERTQKNVTTSYEAGQLYDFELFGDDLDKIEENFRQRMNWIWDIDLEAQLTQAQKLMKP
ncbi:mannitol 1-phosphate dehydrogenase [Curvularia clavata]|uniref:Mannitol 1-phosphate dehydrogenase n=1 Tax=Curvularia clavata TaxID=95742 RepID=A0A9Q8Z009_CURCL|nr:mannitol 1-phosphate dehydrogenase [Curvularia clavata]